MSSLSTSSDQNRGQNALQRRALQLKRWHELQSEEEEKKCVKNVNNSQPKVQFSSATLFLSAVAQNDVQECERLLRSNDGLDVNATTGDGLTALHQMSIDDNLEMVKWLLAHNANTNAKDNEGWTPLHASASCGHLEVIRLLLARPECDVFAINCDGELARDVCDGEECLRAISERMKEDLKATIDLDVFGDGKDDGDDSDDTLIPETLLTEMRRKELTLIETDFETFLRREGPEVSERAVNEWLERTRDPQSGATVLHVCAAKGYTECLNRILEAIHEKCGQLDHWVDSEGFTCLHASAFWQQMSSFESLLKFGADFDLKTRDSRLVSDLCHENPKIMEAVFEAKKARESDAKSITSSETQRRLNAKRQRETRRPTQGVTKEDFEMALKSTQSLTTPADDADDSQTTSPAVQSPPPPPPPPVPSSPPPVVETTPPTTPPIEQNGVSLLPSHPRRRPKRRSTGIEDNLNLSDFSSPQSVAPSIEDNVCVDSHKTPIFSTTSQTTTPQSRSRSSSRSSSVGTTAPDVTDDDKNDDTQRRGRAREEETTRDEEKDYKKLYKELLKENEFLIKKIKDFESSRRAEKEFQDFQREKRQLLRRIGELEEELKQKEDLLKENARLKDENSALIRVISKLSK